MSSLRLALTLLPNTGIITIFANHMLELVMKKTTVMIDEALLDAAVEVSGARSRREAIEIALRTLLRKYNREHLRRELGTYEIDLSLEELESRRNAK